MTKVIVTIGVAMFVTVGGGLIRSVARTDEGAAAAPMIARARADLREIEGRDAMRLGLAAFGRGDFAGCVEQLERVRRPPADVQRTLGICYVKQNDLERGVLHLGQATRLAPDDAIAWRDLGVALRLAEDYDRAEAALARAIALRDDDARSHSSMGVLLLDRDAPEGAVAALRRAAELDASLAFVHANLAVAYARTGRFDLADTELANAAVLGYANVDSVKELIDAEKPVEPSKVEGRR
jgi:Flp pilus assembly protein TadD